MVVWCLGSNFGAKEGKVLWRTECASVLIAGKQIKLQCIKFFYFGEQLLQVFCTLENICYQPPLPICIKLSWNCPQLLNCLLVSAGKREKKKKKKMQNWPKDSAYSCRGHLSCQLQSSLGKVNSACALHSSPHSALSPSRSSSAGPTSNIADLKTAPNSKLSFPSINLL